MAGQSDERSGGEKHEAPLGGDVGHAISEMLVGGENMSDAEKRIEDAIDELIRMVRAEVSEIGDIRISATKDGYVNIEVSEWNPMNEQGTYEDVKRRYHMYASRLDGVWMDGKDSMNSHLGRYGLLLEEGEKQNA